MREGLAREFPEATRAAAWTRGRVGGRRPALWTEPVLWATISGIGAGFLVGAVTQARRSVSSVEAIEALRAPLPALFPLVTIAATAAATAVATRAGGIAALALLRRVHRTRRRAGDTRCGVVLRAVGRFRISAAAGHKSMHGPRASSSPFGRSSSASAWASRWRGRSRRAAQESIRFCASPAVTRSRISS